MTLNCHFGMMNSVSSDDPCPELQQNLPQYEHGNTDTAHELVAMGLDNQDETCVCKAEPTGLVQVETAPSKLGNPLADPHQLVLGHMSPGL
jgi:hypothetical protein